MLGTQRTESETVLMSRRILGVVIGAAAIAVLFTGVPVRAILRLRVSALSALVPKGVASTMMSSAGVDNEGAVTTKKAWPSEPVTTSTCEIEPADVLTLTRFPTSGLPLSSIILTVTTDCALPLCATRSGDAASVSDCAWPPGPMSDGASCLSTVHAARLPAISSVAPVRHNPVVMVCITSSYCGSPKLPKSMPIDPVALTSLPV